MTRFRQLLRNRRLVFGATGIVIVSIVVVATRLASTPTSDKGLARGSTLPIHRIEADHTTYSDVGSLRSTADVIVVGTVSSLSTDPGSSAGSDGAGNPMPAIPYTNYQVKVARELKGGFSLVGNTITVSLVGGTTPTERVVVDGGPILEIGKEYLFFLYSNGAKYDPLAGSAVGAKQPDGSYTFSGDVSGGAPINVSASTVSPILGVKISAATINTSPSPGQNVATFEGSFSLAPRVTLTCADAVAFGVNAPQATGSIDSVKVSAQGSKCIYRRPIGDDGPIQLMVLDLTRHTFVLVLANQVNLSPVRSPVVFQLQLGISQGMQSLIMQQRGSVWTYHP